MANTAPGAKTGGPGGAFFSKSFGFADESKLTADRNQNDP